MFELKMLTLKITRYEVAIVFGLKIVIKEKEIE